MKQVYEGVTLEEVPEFKPSGEYIREFMDRNSICLPADYLRFLENVNGGKLVGPSAQKRVNGLGTVDFFYSLGTDRGFEGIELEWIFRANAFGRELAVPPNVLPIGGFASVYTMGVVFGSKGYGCILYWHDEDIDVESMEEFEEEDFDFFLEERILSASFKELWEELS